MRFNDGVFCILVFFDGLFNVIRGFKWSKPATLDGKDNSFLDSIQSKAIKIIGMFLFTGLYIFTFFIKT